MQFQYTEDMVPARSAWVVFYLLGPVLPAHAADRTILFLFGPQGAGHARKSAEIAASTARRWLRQPTSAIELWRSGGAGAVAVERSAAPKAVDGMFADAATEGRDSDPASFLGALDSAAQILSQRDGGRVLVASLESPPLSREAENSLNQVIGFCQTHSIRVMVLDWTEAVEKKAVPTLAPLSARTGGVLVHDGKSLDNSILSVFAAAPQPGAPPEAQPTPPLATDLPVHTRFIRISSRGLQSSGMERAGGVGRGGGSEVSGGLNVSEFTGPARGLFLVESPFSALKFDIDDNSVTYQARAKLTQTARDATGKIVWQASKTVNLHGPLRKLEDRRRGNLYFLRETQLPAGRYTLEASVEDLIAARSGSVRQPLETGRAIPGFDVSDAMLVRPFSGAGDRLEADQVLSYDGDAIAPMLSPVFDSAKPFDLRLYVVLYPDPQGAQPQLSFELLQQGRVAGRSALPFADNIRSYATEGRGSVFGEQKHQFPYLATLRGVRLGPGEFEARVVVRQGGNVLSRGVNFRVTGAMAQAPAIPGSSQVARTLVEEENVEVTLPEVEPVHVSAAARIPEELQRKLWQDAAADAMSYASRLPNFRCQRETRRLASPVRNAGQFKELDSIVEELTYESGKESYRTREVNGLKSNTNRERLQGVQSRGEFGSMLKAIFRPEVPAGYRWGGRAMAGGTLCAVFEIDVPAAKSAFVLTYNTRQAVAAYQGRVFIDEETGLVRRIDMHGADLPKDFGFQSPVLSLEYGMVRIGDRDHLVPLRSVMQVREGRRLVRNETMFRAYRRFEADSRVVFQ